MPINESSNLLSNQMRFIESINDKHYQILQLKVSSPFLCISQKYIHNHGLHFIGLQK